MMPTLKDPDPALADQIRLAELATAKLKRQQQRILENDAALLCAKPKSGRKSKIEWKPLSLTNSSDDNISAPDSADSRNPTPFDVHAKIFRPSARSSRDSSTSRISVPAGDSRSMTKITPASVSGDDDGGDFQLVTGKKTKPTSRPALALNPYKAKPSEKIATVAASFNMKEINEVFGNELPPPEFVQSNPGVKQGQIQFVIHPNGDIAAQQWCFKKYQWTNIGQYSNIRRRREGMLAASRLKGETEQQTLLQNTLAYFRAVAMQSEALEMGKSWGPKEISAYLPAPQATVPAIAHQNEEPRPTANFTPSIVVPKAPTNYALPQGFTQKPQESSFMPAMPRSEAYASLNSMSFGGFPAVVVHESVTGDTLHQSSSGMSSLEVQNLTPTSAESYGAYPAWYRQPLPQSAMHMPGRVSQPLQNMDAANVGYDHNAMTTTIEANYVVPASDEDLVERAAVERFQPGWQSDRSAVRDYLSKIGENASARGMGTTSTPRTVLHDPLRAESFARHENSPLDSQSSNSARDPSRADHNLHTSSPLPQSHDHGAEARRDLVGFSEPDPGPWNMRRHDVVNVETPSTLSHEQLALYSMPTPQNWNGPWFTGSPEQNINKKSYDEELRDWFLGGNTRARQDEFYERIKAAHIASAPSGRRSPGPIGPPNSSSKSHDNSGKSVDFNETTTRLLIPVLENLASYVEGPKEKRHGPFARYAPPPEWCIDRGPNGNKSFFGEDWGQPPERIGRDSRYRPMNYEGRFGNYESQLKGKSQPQQQAQPQPQPAIGTLTGLGRSAQPMEGRTRFGSGRKW